MCPPTYFFGGSAPVPRSDGAGPAHSTDALRFAHRRAGEKPFFSRIGTILFDISRGLRPRTPGYFSLAGKVPKRAHKGGTLSMGSLPYGSLPHDDTKGGACPPLDTPAWLMVVLCYQGDSRKNKWEDSSPPSDGEQYGEHSRSEWSLFSSPKKRFADKRKQGA